jgi:aryl-alcohol dehydrogenase-like predicted oxidoreductase
VAQLSRAVEWYGGQVDLMQLHNLGGLARVWRDARSRLGPGWIALMGATHYSAAAFDGLAEPMATDRIDTVQKPYNTVQREAERTTLPLAEDLGLGVLPGEGPCRPPRRPNSHRCVVPSTSPPGAGP